MMKITDRYALPKGAKVGAYVVSGILGRGGFGITYLAKHRSTKQIVALKELLPADIAFRHKGKMVTPRKGVGHLDFDWAKQRFLEEAKTLALFDSPYLVSVHDVFEANETAYMATSYKKGKILRDWLNHREEPLNEDELKKILFPLMNGLEEVHGYGLLHRDINPNNIYVCDDGTPMLLDFGSARQMISRQSRPMTLMITPGFAPFEQYHSDGQQGPWTDIYSLGGVCYFMIKGKVPPDAADRVKQETYFPLAKTRRGGYSHEFLSAVDQALTLNARERIQDISQWRDYFAKKKSNAKSKSVITKTISGPRGVGLTVSGSNRAGERYAIFLSYQYVIDDPGGIVIGRSETDAQIVLPDPSVSKRHAKIRFEEDEGHLVVEDLDSCNGLLVDGQKLQSQGGGQPIEETATLEIGEVSLVVFWLKPTEIAPTIPITQQVKKKQPPPLPLDRLTDAEVQPTELIAESAIPKPPPLPKPDPIELLRNGKSAGNTRILR